ncbi:MAG: hypothetical protein CMJ75_15440 [Planctomycetaceae bacterium]|nr:hypothetical protein [Planctomycetaceae bacterium]
MFCSDDGQIQGLLVKADFFSVRSFDSAKYNVANSPIRGRRHAFGAFLEKVDWMSAMVSRMGNTGERCGTGSVWRRG